MTTTTFFRGLLFLILIALAMWSLAPVIATAEEPLSSPAEILTSPPTPTSHALSAEWVDQIRSSLQSYQSSYPSSNFEPYLKRLTVVREAIERGDRQAVRTEMNGFFRMLVSRAHGVNEIAAEELTNFAQMVAPMEEYRLSVPRPSQ